MSTLSKKLLKDCKKHSDSPKRKLGKKLMSHELELSAILPLIQQLADSEDKQQQAAEMLIELLAPKASSKHQQALAVQLEALGIGKAKALPSGHQTKASTASNPLKLVPANDSFARKPFKTKPCSSCPALRNGLCKCALKRASKQRPTVAEQPRVAKVG